MEGSEIARPASLGRDMVSTQASQRAPANGGLGMLTDMMGADDGSAQDWTNESRSSTLGANSPSAEFTKYRTGAERREDISWGLDDCARVWTTPTGTPARLVCRGEEFQIVERPQFWVDRKPWWTKARRLPAGVAGSLLEQPMWHVRASQRQGRPVTFDLAADPESVYWPVTGVYDG